MGSGNKTLGEALTAGNWVETGMREGVSNTYRRETQGEIAAQLLYLVHLALRC